MDEQTVIFRIFRKSGLVTCTQNSNFFPGKFHPDLISLSKFPKKKYDFFGGIHLGYVWNFHRSLILDFNRCSALLQAMLGKVLFSLPFAQRVFQTFNLILREKMMFTPNVSASFIEYLFILSPLDDANSLLCNWLNFFYSKHLRVLK